MGGFMGVPGSNPGGPIIFRGKIEGASLILPEAKEDWAKVGVRGSISRAKRNFIKPRSGIRDCVGVGPRGRISRRPDELKGILTSSD